MSDNRSSPLLPDFSDGPVSLNTLRIALLTMKDRCTRQQRQIDDLEREKTSLQSSRSDMYEEVKRLHETNVKLREKNLKLNHELHQKSRENVDIRDKLHSLQNQHHDSIRQVEKLQTQIIAMTSRESGISLTEDEDDEDSSSLQQPMSVEYHSLREDDLDELKTELIVQQQAIKEAMVQMALSLREKQRHERSAGPSVAISSIRPATPPTETSRVCPMCESKFALSVPQEDFEMHVFEHFNQEESETLTNFDTVPDAFSIIDH